MSGINHGGAAFPLSATSDGAGYSREDGQRGMTLRDYFMAHAPAEPQPWFRPVMPAAPTVRRFSEAPDNVLEELKHADYADWTDERDMSPAALEWHTAVKEDLKAAAAFRAESDKQRYVQWPAAWADEMLERRRA